MDDNPETPSPSTDLYTNSSSHEEEEEEDSLLPLPPSPTQTLDGYWASQRPKLDHHASAHKLFDEIAKDEQPGSQHGEEEEEEIELCKSTKSLEEDSGEPLLVPLVAEGDADSELQSPLAVDNNGSNNDHLDGSESRILYGRSHTEVCKPLLSIASSSSGWNDDVYEKPSNVGAGLQNLGNTCFLNAILQCFTHTVLLVQGLYSYNHAASCDCEGERFCLFCALWEHIELSLSSTGKIVTPLKFVDNLSYFSSSFRRFQQEDAHEFLQCFLDRLESSFGNLKAKDVANSSQNDNLVKQAFGGRVVSRLKCCNCDHCSDTYEPSVDLSLEIEDANNLPTALESFTKIEHIDGKFKCEKCKEEVPVNKQLLLDQTPPVCAFHLKRFKNDGAYVEKIDKHVEFPLELDLQPYTHGSQINNADLTYELYAVVVHAAFTSTCGHYYCYIRTAPDTWHKFDDSRVIKVSEAYVLSEEAYILFYARQGTPWFSNLMETYKSSLDPSLSNTSPKSVLDNVDHTCTSSPDSANNHSHNFNETNKSENNIFTGPFNRSREDRFEAATKDHRSQSYNAVPLQPSNFSGGKASNNVVKVISPSALKDYGSNHDEPKKNAGVTPTRHDRLEVADSKDDNDAHFTSPLLRPSNSSGGRTTSDIAKEFSPSTPPRSPSLDLSDDENSEVVFAPKPGQLKLVEKPSCKRQRSKDVDVSAKQEALRQCRKMPGARGNLLMAALDEPSKSEASLNKRSKKMPSSPRKYSSRLSDRYKHSHNPISRNLSSSFR